MGKKLALFPESEPESGLFQEQGELSVNLRHRFQIGGGNPDSGSIFADLL
jgi:hypothetical protein